MLEEEGGTRLGPQSQNPAARSLAEANRPGQPGSFGAGDLVPAQYQGRIGKARADKSRLAHQPGIGAERANPPAARAVLRLFVLGRHVAIMPPSQRPKQNHKPQARDFAAELLAWYDVHARELPWRAKRGERADPYHVWLSEIMLQQTTVQAVARYYRKFLDRWPTVQALAEAPLDDVLAAWAGLGYYARARNLHKAVRMVANELDGKFPDTFAGLRGLPGIGEYTAGAIASIAFDLPHAAMDANAERVVARLFAVEEPLPGAKTKIRTLGQSLVPQKRAGDFAQALMDLGSTICTPRRPACRNCPWTDECEARKRGIQEHLPVKAEKPRRPLRRGAAFVARDPTGAILLVRRPEKGLLGSMMQPPLGPWTEDFPSKAEAMKQAPFKADWKKRPGTVRHGFTHFELEIEVYVAEIAKRPKVEGKWTCSLSGVALPTVMRKLIAHAVPMR